MTRQQPPASQGPTDVPTIDPWRSFSYLTTGVLLYGAIGWLLDRWLGTSFLVAVGIILGAGLGIYTIFSRYNRTPPGASPDKRTP